MSSPQSSQSVPPPLPEILLLGCVGAGKTVLLRQFKRFCEHRSVKSVEYQQRMSTRPISLATASTTGFERDELRYQGVSFVVREVGGPMRSTWPSYTAKSTGIVFVIDRSSPHQVSASCMELMTLLTSAAVATQPVWIVLNKTDSSFSMSRPTLDSLFQLDDLVHFRSATGVPTYVVDTSGITAYGVVTLLNQILPIVRDASQKINIQNKT